MAFTGMCPYLKDARSLERTICECARFTFPDKSARREILYGYCGHPSAWKVCPLKLAMDHHYERRFAQPNENDKSDRISKRMDTAS